MRVVSVDAFVFSVFWGVAVKPGKPVSFGVRGETLVFGLPGNPVSSLVGCELFVRPALLALQGAAVKRSTAVSTTSRCSIDTCASTAQANAQGQTTKIDSRTFLKTDTRIILFPGQ